MTKVEAFRKAAELLRFATSGSYMLYSANGALHLMRGDSHDKEGHPRRHAIVDTALRLNVGGGDW